jgi:chitodextrinase
VSDSWDFGDGSTGTGVSPIHTYATAGDYTVKLKVSDDSGHSATTTHTVSISDRPPQAAFSFSPLSPQTGQPVSFDGSGSTDPDGSVAFYYWDFGDGSARGVGLSPTHTYAKEGPYTVTLTVRDNSGSTTVVSQPIDVSAPPATSRSTPPNSMSPANPIFGPLVPPAVPVSDTAPILSSIRATRVISFAAYRRHGLSIDITCRTACQVMAELRTVRRHNHATPRQRNDEIVLARGSARLNAGRRGVVRLRPLRAALKTLRPGAVIKATVVIRTENTQHLTNLVKRTIIIQG